MRSNAHAIKEGVAKRMTPFVTCSSDVVYRTALSCGRVYVRQTGRCLNKRSREHSYSLRASVGGHLPVHNKTGLSRPSFDDTTTLGRHRDEVTREMIEVFLVVKKHNVSANHR